MKEDLAASTSRLTGYSISIQPAMAAASPGWTNGSAAHQVSKAYQLSGTATAVATDIDLATVICADGTTGFTRVRIFAIYNDATLDTAILTTGGGTNPFKPYLTGTTPTISIEPGGVLFLIKPLGTLGWLVDETNKVLRLDPGAATVPFRVVIFGN